LLYERRLPMSDLVMLVITIVTFVAMVALIGPLEKL
jgi:hypothetical protein